MKITRKYLTVIQYAWSKIMDACKKAKIVTEWKVVDKFLADCMETIDIETDTEDNSNQLNLRF